MIKAKLFRDKDNVAEKVEDFINSNSIDDVISIVKIADMERVLLGGAKLTYATELLLIYREGNE